MENNEIENNNEITENTVENTTENEITENEVEENTNTIILVDNNISDQITQVHEDLGIVTSFLIFFSLIIILRYVYKFFNMFFVI